MNCSGAASDAVAATTVVNSIAPALVSRSTTWATVELGEPLLRPGEVLFLFPRRLREPVAGGRVARGQCLRLVERLRAHLSRMVDPHEPRRVTPLVERELRFRQAAGRMRARTHRAAGEGAQRAVETEDQLINH